MSEPLNDQPVFSLVMEVTPSPDGRWMRTQIQLRHPQSRVPQVFSSTSSTDLLFEKLQGELNNMLRQLVNQLDQQIIKPMKKAKR